MYVHICAVEGIFECRKYSKTSSNENEVGPTSSAVLAVTSLYNKGGHICKDIVRETKG